MLSASRSNGCPSPWTTSSLHSSIAFGPERRAGRLVLRAETSADGATAVGDRAKTDQALQNIVDNALKFTQVGEVVVTAGVDRDRVEVTVRDTGPGIPSRDLSRIFERFYKVDRSRGGLPGRGLGLSIARHLVELQGGTIVAESSGGSGTIVPLRLPRDPLASPQPGPHQAATTRAAP